MPVFSPRLLPSLSQRLAGSILSLSALAPLSAGCSLGEGEGDGLRIENPIGQYEFARSSSVVGGGTSGETNGQASESTGVGAAGDGGGGTGGSGTGGSGPIAKKSCLHLDLFTTNVTPHFIERCIKCHDGRKLKAILTFDLELAADESAESQQVICLNTLDSIEPADLVQSTIFTEVDPDNDATEHDFKYPNAELYTEYLNSVMLWLEQEVAAQAAQP